jgi:PIN domain nuclease of toxin-antitoxin system
MKIIIDTHIFLLAISDPAKLGKKNKQAIETLSNTIYLSTVSLTELMIKSSIGKIEIDFDPIAIAKKSGFELLDFSAEDALALKEMPFHHKDPFDRMLISQAMNRKFSLMSDDRKLGKYECRLV